jgi:outer membrane protein OmpA-like peptidoglycan-associated protein
LVLSDSIWTGARENRLTPKAATKLEPLGALLANSPDYQIQIDAFSDSKGDEITLQQFTQDRARALAERFAAAGIDASRIQANGMGPANPVAPNTTVAGRTRNRRIEITLTPTGRSTASSQ